MDQFSAGIVQHDQIVEPDLLVGAMVNVSPEAYWCSRFLMIQDLAGKQQP